MRRHAFLLLGMTASFLVSCSSEAPTDEGRTAKKVDPKAAASDPLPKFESDDVGTPMKERVAVLGLLNKRTGQARDIELKPGEEMRLGKVVLRLRSCEKTKPWETYPDEGAFIQVNVLQRPPGTNDKERWMRVFSGWIFKENPAANVVLHPVYDVYVKACKMTFPGEEADKPLEPETGDGATKTESNAAQSPDADSNSAPAREPTAQSGALET